MHENVSDLEDGQMIAQQRNQMDPSRRAMKVKGSDLQNVVTFLWLYDRLGERMNRKKRTEKLGEGI